ncbi:uncharacterized protein DUF4339 [Prosthecobacter fusiformis]|uniref:Uncharacterized protein DUF4339 n=1 Tax=Prosthecobacter fusiformis TaxID=48464 RepID=A0A4R7RL32_9BACT|nr:DUF4339 domain-containing protein [Prosthecobacter fusiformis]TDU66014.1 uncharacterized protein DUF4339 [Prosthecobacter fusiformis]
MPTPVLEATYYISKGQKVVGPCTLDDLYSYIAYGSVRESDLVRREGATDWTPLKALEELHLDTPDSQTARELTTRRRTARYRDYAKVPRNRRSGIVLWRLIIGFLLFPPLLWKAAITVFQDRIFTTKTDPRGYLESWPRWCEPVISGMIIVNTLAWTAFVWSFSQESAPVVQELAAIFSTGMVEIQRWFNQ